MTARGRVYSWLVDKVDRVGRAVWDLKARHLRGAGSGGHEAPTLEREIEFWAHHAPRKQRNFWDTYAYDQQAVAKSQRIVQTLKELDLPADFTLHEFGCNLGRNLWHIHQAFPRARLSGNDVNPLAPEKCREYFGDFADLARIDLTSTQEFLLHAVKAGMKYDVCLSADHFIHIPDDSVETLARYVPCVVSRYLVLRESFGTHSRGSAWYRRWTTNDAVHWFDRDYVCVFSGLRCVKKSEDYRTPSGKVYAIYVFQRQADGALP